MDEFEKLKEIGIEKIFSKTHIDIEAIEFILSKNFEKLKKFNVIGFIKILEREFNLNLDDFKSEFIKFKSEHNENCNKINIWPQLDTYVNNKSSKNFGLILTILALLFLIIFYIYNFKIYEKFDFSEIFHDKNRSTIYSDSKIVEVVSKKVEIPSVVFTKKDENLSKKIEPEILDLNETIIKSDENLTSLQNLQEEQNSTSIEILDTKEQNYKTFINPHSNIWIGIIDLKTKRKKSLQTEEIYELDLNKDAILITGHGNFELNIAGEIQNYTTKNSKRFLIKQGKIKEINFNEFLKLNGGKNW